MIADKTNQKNYYFIMERASQEIEGVMYSLILHFLLNE